MWKTILPIVAVILALFVGGAGGYTFGSGKTFEYAMTEQAKQFRQRVTAQIITRVRLLRNIRQDNTDEAIHQLERMLDASLAAIATNKLSPTGDSRLTQALREAKQYRQQHAWESDNPAIGNAARETLAAVEPAERETEDRRNAAPQQNTGQPKAE